MLPFENIVYCGAVTLPRANSPALFAPILKERTLLITRVFVFPFLVIPNPPESADGYISRIFFVKIRAKNAGQIVLGHCTRQKFQAPNQIITEFLSNPFPGMIAECDLLFMHYVCSINWFHFMPGDLVTSEYINLKYSYLKFLFALIKCEEVVCSWSLVMIIVTIKRYSIQSCVFSIFKLAKKLTFILNLVT